MFLDRHYTVVPFHRVLASMVYPFHYAVDAPGRFVHWTRVVWGSKQALIHETEALHHEQLQLKTQLQHLLGLQNENKNLKNLLALSDASSHRMMAADVLAVETGRVHHVLIINKGSRDGVTSGQLVLDEEGVTGQVVEVGLMTSTVLLISDAASAVPVRNQRTGETAILTGTHDMHRLALIHLPKTVSIKTGDILLTSGLEQRYPAGYPVGVVDVVDSLPGEAFIRVDVRPFTKLDRNRLVLLVWPDKKQDALVSEVKARRRNVRSKS
jgi:rod shape-determining protein MreC